MELAKMKSNFGRGPTTGNQARAGKRAAFKEGKAERSSLADSINSAFSKRHTEDFVDAKLESVKDTVKPKKFKR